MKKIRSYFVKYRSADGRCLVGGVMEGFSSRFQEESDAQQRMLSVLEVNGDHCHAEIVPSPRIPEIFVHCGRLAQAIGGHCFGCGKILTAVDARKAVQP